MQPPSSGHVRDQPIHLRYQVRYPERFCDNIVLRDTVRTFVRSTEIIAAMTYHSSILRFFDLFTPRIGSDLIRISASAQHSGRNVSTYSNHRDGLRELA